MNSLSGSDGKASACNVGDLSLIPGLGRSLEKEMATHSSTLAWKIPWAEEPGRLQSTGVAKSRTRLSYFTHFTQLVWTYIFNSLEHIFNSGNFESHGKPIITILGN